MKKITMMCAVLLMLGTSIPTTQAAETRRGGFMGFIAGCCFGPRAGAAYNDGKSLHWKEWTQVIPVVGLIVGIMNGIEASNGMDSSDYAKQYGSIFY